MNWGADSTVFLSEPQDGYFHTITWPPGEVDFHDMMFLHFAVAYFFPFTISGWFPDFEGLVLHVLGRFTFLFNGHILLILYCILNPLIHIVFKPCFAPKRPSKSK